MAAGMSIPMISDSRNAGREKMKRCRLLLGLLLTGLMFLTDFNSACAEESEAKDAPVNGRKYAMEQVQKYFANFDAAYQCTVQYIPTDKNTENYDSFYNIRDKCRALIQQALDFRVDITTRPNLIFDNENERKNILADASVIEANQKLMAEYWRMIIQYTDENSIARRALSFSIGLTWWYKDHHNKYEKNFNDIISLMKDYNHDRNKCKVESQYTECSDSTLKSMKKTLNKMSEYFTFDVDLKVLIPRSKGAFIEDYDNYSRNFIARNKDFITTFDNVKEQVGKFKDRITKQHVGVLGMVKLRNKSIFSPHIGKYPENIQLLTDRLYTFVDNVQKFIKELPEGDIGKFLSRSRLDDTGTASAHRSLELSLSRLLLRAKDKNGNWIKHHVGK